MAIWDEAPNSNEGDYRKARALLQTMRRKIRTVRRRKLRLRVCGKRPFMLLGGDKKQISPVVRPHSRERTVRASISSLRCVSALRRVKLARPMRCKNRRFGAWAEKLGNGKLGTKVKDSEGSQKYIKLPAWMRQERVGASEKEFQRKAIQHAFPDLDTLGEMRFRCTLREAPLRWGVRRRYYREGKKPAMRGWVDPKYVGAIREFASQAVLCPTNRGCRAINQAITKKWQGYRHDLLSATYLNIDDEKLDVPGLNTVEASGGLPGLLQVKEGQVVAVQANLGNGLLKNTRCLVLRVQPKRNMVTVARLSDINRKSGKIKETYSLPRILQEIDLPLGMESITLWRKQFPINHVGGVTVDRSQGQSFARVSLDLRSNFWSHGQT